MRGSWKASSAVTVCGALLSLEVKFGGMEVSDAKRLRELLSENDKLNKLLAEQMLDNATLKGFHFAKVGEASREAECCIAHGGA